ncbi:thioredoxin family protein [Thermosulfurimonas sp. F29]|uniref:thioredoxin family protein n=1 Tax=Thermosulfurimonas sp. F29 TaxID=2867247 RepID=UPI001C828AE8|nr:thioredoxin family protein [Thermosulfurimonas sp. F29]MBX6422782.1 thioredoxin family protein [Thermosulfurimonas sp. F29]
MVREIRVLGPGCPRCEALYDNVVLALDELGIDATVEKVKDLGQIAAHGVMQTPGLVVDGRVVSQGKVLSVEEIKELLRSR